jgi:hydrogenase/urease accessory protein HupE
MRSIPRLLSAVLVAAVVALPAQAHPGHQHTDIPSLIRHPFAGPEHLLGSAAVGLAVAAALYVATRRVTVPALARWTTLSVVAVAVTLGMAT